MSAHTARRFRRSLVPLVVGIVALGGMGAFLVFAPLAAAGGWLTAFVFWSGIPTGCLAASMIHRLTGGAWGERFAPVFIPTAAALPLMLLLLVPVLAELHVFYPWVGGAKHVAKNVHALYLNIPFFIARSALALAGWSVIAFVLPRLSGTAGMVASALGLIFYAVMVSVLAIDWILSLEPRFMSTAMGGTLAVTQLASALAWAAIFSPRPTGDRAHADLGALLLSALLGTTYLNFMTVLIIWYGDLPDQVRWFVLRDYFPWTLVGAFAFLCGSVIPIIALFLAPVRASRRGLRLVGIVALTGIAVYEAWLIAPPFGVLAVGAAGLALLAIGALLVAFVATPWARAGMQRWRSANVA